VATRLAIDPRHRMPSGDRLYQLMVCNWGKRSGSPRSSSGLWEESAVIEPFTLLAIGCPAQQLRHTRR